jgi:ketosteroid isomerase-like protein
MKCQDCGNENDSEVNFCKNCGASLKKSPSKEDVSITFEQVETLFNYLRTGENDQFFDHVTDDVDWTVMGTHPLAGTYHSKQDFVSSTFNRLNRILKEDAVFKVNNIIVKEDTAVVEMESLSTALNGMLFNNTYCWVVRFKNDLIVEVRAYVDSALVQMVIDANEKLG